jgi:hypothetical protein
MKKSNKILMIMPFIVIMGYCFVGGIIYQQTKTPDYWEFTNDPDVFYYLHDTLIPGQMWDTIDRFGENSWQRSIRIYNPRIFPGPEYEDLRKYYTDDFMDEFIYGRPYRENTIDF